MPCFVDWRSLPIPSYSRFNIGWGQTTTRIVKRLPAKNGLSYYIVHDNWFGYQYRFKTVFSSKSVKLDEAFTVSNSVNTTSLLSLKTYFETWISGPKLLYVCLAFCDTFYAMIWLVNFINILNTVRWHTYWFISSRSYPISGSHCSD